MIVGIEGEVVRKEPTLLHVKTSSGLTYGVRVSLNTSSKIDQKNICLHTTLVVRDDAQILFGFYDLDEKSIFDTVIKLNGIGPSTALAICSTLSPSDFASALTSQDINAFKKVPGIGPKSAKRILVELSDFALESLINEENGNGTMINEASLALESLGVKKDKIKKALTNCKATELSEIIKEALQKLG